MDIKTEHLSGKALDWAVATAEAQIHPARATQIQALWQQGLYSPSTNWNQGGPIMEREFMRVTIYISHEYPWFVEKRHFGPHNKGGRNYGQGETLLEAVARCFVAATLGPVVTIPDQEYA